MDPGTAFGSISGGKRVYATVDPQEEAYDQVPVLHGSSTGIKVDLEI